MLLRRIKKKLRNIKKNKSSPLLSSSLILLNFKLSGLDSESNAAVTPSRVLNWRSCGFRSLQQYQQRQTLPPHRRTMSTTTTMCPSLTAEGWKRAEEKRQGPGKATTTKKGPNDARCVVWALCEFFFILHVFI